MAHAFNLSYLGNLNRIAVQEAQAKSYRDSISTKKLGIMVSTCNPNHVWGHISRRMAVWGLDLGKNARPYMRNN
jgi:hypothetical protein